MKTTIEPQSNSVTAPPAINQPVAENADSFTSQHECQAEAALSNASQQDHLSRYQYG